jgi:hypothetical protein
VSRGADDSNDVDARIMARDNSTDPNLVACVDIEHLFE